MKPFGVFAPNREMTVRTSRDSDKSSGARFHLVSEANQVGKLGSWCGVVENLPQLVAKTVE